MRKIEDWKTEMVALFQVAMRRFMSLTRTFTIPPSLRVNEAKAAGAASTAFWTFARAPDRRLFSTNHVGTSTSPKPHVDPNTSIVKMLIPKADRKLIHEYLFRGKFRPFPTR